MFGGKSLWPTDPYKKALAQTLVSDFGSQVSGHTRETNQHTIVSTSHSPHPQFVSNYYKYYRKQNDEKTDAAVTKFIQVMEQYITNSGNKFLMGEEVGAADFLVWPWFERLEALADFFGEFSSKIHTPYSVSVITRLPLCVTGIGTLVNQQKQPVFYGWVARMHEVEAVKATSLSIETHVSFLKSAIDSGGTKHNYGVADQSGKGMKIYASKPSQ